MGSENLLSHLMVGEKHLSSYLELLVKLVIYLFFSWNTFFLFERMTYLKELKFSHNIFLILKDFSDVISGDINYEILKYTMMGCANIWKMCIT